MLMTNFCSLISLTVRVFGTSSSIPDCRMGAVIMKMISRTRTTSMNGTMLISDRDDCVLEICGINLCAAGWRGRRISSAKRLFDLCGDFQCEGVQPLPKIANILQELIVENNRRDGDKKSSGSG